MAVNFQTTFQHWFRYWYGTGQPTSHYLNQWWLVCWRIYASFIRPQWVKVCKEPKVEQYSNKIKLSSVKETIQSLLVSCVSTQKTYLKTWHMYAEPALNVYCTHHVLTLLHFNTWNHRPLTYWIVLRKQNIVALQSYKFWILQTALTDAFLPRGRNKIYIIAVPPLTNMV